jgi:monoamine oxidase
MRGSLNSSRDTVKKMEYDYIIIRSGFGGLVSALRLSKKGYMLWLKRKMVQC